MTTSNSISVNAVNGSTRVTPKFIHNLIPDFVVNFVPNLNIDSFRPLPGAFIPAFSYEDPRQSGRGVSTVAGSPKFATTFLGRMPSARLPGEVSALRALRAFVVDLRSVRLEDSTLLSSSIVWCGCIAFGSDLARGISGLGLPRRHEEHEEAVPPRVTRPEFARSVLFQVSFACSGVHSRLSLSLQHSFHCQGAVLDGAVEPLRGDGGFVDQFAAGAVEGHDVPILPIDQVRATLDPDALPACAAQLQ
jgi:hypothetical protein